MAKRASFIERIRPLRARSRVIDWPLHCEGDRPKVRVRVLTQDDLEDAYFAALEHFKDVRPGMKPKADDPPVVARERTELVWRAFSDPETDEPLAETADELAEHGDVVVMALYAAWGSFQNEITVRPLTQEAMNDLIEHLKKNTSEEALRALPSTWLIALITTLVSRLPDSTSSNKPG